MQLRDARKVFLELVRAGLWGKEVLLAPYNEIDFVDSYKLAQEQSVVGLLAAGLEKVNDTKVSQNMALTIAGEVLQIEQRNKAMNSFIAWLIDDLRKKDVYAILEKGQGIALCYERPLWRMCGDVDLLLSDGNYKKAKAILTSMADKVEEENTHTKHYAVSINDWEVELHGTLRGELFPKIDKGLDKIQEDIFYGGNVRSWVNGNTQIFLPGVDNDVVFVFTHILQHFFKGGIGLRQVCDWCRLLWVYKDEIDRELLRYRLFALGIETEWKAFAAMAVDSLGMPEEAMPLYSPASKWKNKGCKIMDCIFETGNFGHNRDNTFRVKGNYLSRKLTAMWRYTEEGLKHFAIFPLDSIKVWFGMMRSGLRAVIKTK